VILERELIKERGVTFGSSLDIEAKDDEESKNQPACTFRPLPMPHPSSVFALGLLERSES